MVSKFFILVLVIAVVVSLLTKRWTDGLIIVSVFAAIKIALNFASTDRA